MGSAKYCASFLVGLLWLTVSSAGVGMAQTSSEPNEIPGNPFQPPLDVVALQTDTLLQKQPGLCPTGSSIVTINTICQLRLTIPSLWWAKEQFSGKEQFGGRLLENWLAYRGDGNMTSRIDLVVNAQVWSLLNDLDRYAFVHKFGNIARSYGYNIRVFNRQGAPLASYVCDFSPVSPLQEGARSEPLTPELQNEIRCNLILVSSSRRGLLQTKPSSLP
ncbi:hypothetical protein [Leptolyngbya sp. 'hensonii']|uniref:hypothetical protein n=1 Tax=Leptolyngbya sp. 'hensonii' TaxID=1922337 RepID=UPI000ADA9FDE|nr:hypothetical protein [Leptolyngbya sp. 'hensonii']